MKAASASWFGMPVSNEGVDNFNQDEFTLHCRSCCYSYSTSLALSGNHACCKCAWCKTVKCGESHVVWECIYTQWAPVHSFPGPSLLERPHKWAVGQWKCQLSPAKPKCQRWRRSQRKRAAVRDRLFKHAHAIICLLSAVLWVLLHLCLFFLSTATVNPIKGRKEYLTAETFFFVSLDRNRFWCPAVIGPLNHQSAEKKRWDIHSQCGCLWLFDAVSFLLWVTGSYISKNRFMCVRWIDWTSQ